MSSAVPPVDQSLLPAGIRNGDAKAKQAYATALGFERILVQQLTQELSASAGVDGAGGDGAGDAGGTGSSDAAASAYGQLLPNALTSSIMSAGGLGLALGLAQSLDPAIGVKK
jgi:hypothetical protein